MSQVNARIEIDAPPEEVWEVLMDPERLPDWVTIHRKLGKVSDRPLRKGSSFDQTLCLRGANFKVHWKVTELEPNRLARWEGRGPARSRAHIAYRVSANGDCTTFDYENDFRAPLGPLGAATSRVLVGGVPEREAKASLQRLKQLFER